MTECTGEARQKKGEVMSLFVTSTDTLFLSFLMYMYMFMYMYMYNYHFLLLLQFDELPNTIPMEKEFIFIRINVLREVSLTLCTY